MDIAVEARLYARLAAVAAKPGGPVDAAEEWAAELDALAAISLIDGGERQEWEGRLDEVVALLTKPTPPSSEVLERARRYLQQRVGKLERRLAWSRPLPEDVAADVLAIRAAGGLDDAEESRWLDRIAAADGDARLGFGELRAVVTPAIPPAEDITVTALELWSGAVVVRFLCGQQASARSEFEVGFWEFALGDDAGTDYSGRAGAFNRSGGMRGYEIFAPGPPAEAHRMHVSHADATFDIPLR